MTILRRRTPFETIQPFDSLRDFMDMFNAPFGQMAEVKPYSQGNGLLPVDVSEKDNEYIIRATLPGFNKDDIEVQVHEGVVTIKAEHSEEDGARTRSSIAGSADGIRSAEALRFPASGRTSTRRPNTKTAC